MAVNRYWEQLFGTGLVETLEDFGSAGETPSHPELLDWLALHFQNDLHWDMKALLREMVTSAAYRQSADAPRQRCSKRSAQPAAGAWAAAAAHRRDGARPGAAGQRASQSHDGRPAGDAAAAGRRLELCLQQSKLDRCHRADRYRRAVYTFIKRTAGYPSFIDLRRRRPRYKPAAPHPHQYAAAGAGDPE